MELKDVIRQDADRLFILDHDCYVIFTGDTVEDEKPFIRIGNWINLPVEIIPLIENIIVTDRLAGNPSHEQFNIDVNYLPTNRYIGSRMMVKRYLDFQKTFGLDLTNVSVVEIEKDIPEISREKIISDRDSFIGVFYTNGDFQVTHNRRSLFSLKGPEGGYFDELRVMDTISESSRESSRYAGSGFIVLSNNPIFYKNRYFTLYHFPRACCGDFARLEIDPGQVRELILPSSNLINITRLVRWKHHSHGRLKIFSDRKDDIDLLQRLFAGASIIRKDFGGFSFDSGDGLAARNYPGSYNVRVLYKKTKPALEDIAVGYIKGFEGVQTVVKDDLDIILVSYPVYEETNLVFKSTDTPIVLIPGPGRPPVRSSAGGPIMAMPGIQYELCKYGEAAEMVADIKRQLGANETADIMATGEIDAIAARFPEAGNDAPSKFESVRETMNMLALLKLRHDTTTDRKLAAALWKLIASRRGAADPASIHSDNAPRFRICLALCDGSLYEYMEKLSDSPPSFAVLDEAPEDDTMALERINDPELHRHYETIIEDRRRLRELLGLFAGRTKDEARMRELRAAIAEKKRRYEYESIEDLGLSEGRPHRARMAAYLRKALVPLGILVLLALAALAWRYGAPLLEERRMAAVEEERARREAEERRVREGLIEKYGISVSDHDIFTYVNRVAVKNGYAPIPFASMKTRNPNWIYPGNVFVMPDGERVEVREGDTLWGISHTRLQDRAIEFHRTLEGIEKAAAGGTDIAPLVAKARDLAPGGAYERKLEALLGRVGK